MSETKHSIRTLQLYSRLSEGAVVNAEHAAREYGVNKRSIQRDIDDINEFLAEELHRTGSGNAVSYDRAAGGYRMEELKKTYLTNAEVLAICKILLDSRAFTKPEMEEMLEKLITRSVPKENQVAVKELIKNEEFHYVELRHHTKFIDRMWDIGQAIREHRYIEIKYQKLGDPEVQTRKLQPQAIMFSEYYFYLAAFWKDKEARKKFSVPNDPYPTIYRIDRIQGLKVLDEHFNVPYKDRFEEGEFRKRIQFMFGGRLRKIRFKCKGLSVESVLDRLPTAVIEKEEKGAYTIYAEVFGDGIDMWLRSQGDAVELVE